MRQLPSNIEKGVKAYGRILSYTEKESPSRNSLESEIWKECTVDHTQYDRRGNLIVIVSGNEKIYPQGDEGVRSNQDKIHSFKINDIIFESELLN